MTMAASARPSPSSWLLVALSAVFSAAETALTGASRGRMHQLERDGDRAAGRVNRLIADRETMIGAVLLGNNLINILVSALATEVLTTGCPRRLGRRRRHRRDDRAGLGLRRGAAQDPGHHPRRRRGALRCRRRPLFVVRAVQARSSTPCSGSCAARWRLFGVERRHRRPTCWPPTRRSAARSSTTTPRALVESRDRRHAGRRARPGGDGRSPRSWCTARTIAMLDADLPAARAGRRRRSRCGHTRLPLYRGEPENIVGVLHAKDLLRAIAARRRRLDAGRHRRRSPASPGSCPRPPT